ncbi:MAG: ABC transporter ATP-binding protein [Caldilineaceae bacterium SB0670_bin_27]|uniref:ABC transporter ATP-binding protein n=1 Tax=Caldilineaceae bacterium SB0664_bin_27 TaxID=2605260 RepID=A0A6B0YX72_9CHLR|nr:ABC transporter ATP-binding protein [Caldilineaceae bacterium SB0664_bin_27]MYJ79169.1 ABC transporter ATP-binding protein [Caldilineaceae bacterium SB0670_bin_27]
MIEARNSDTLLDVLGLHTYFYTYEGVVKAVNSVSYKLNRGEITGLVGESGSGKSVTAQSIIRLVKAPGKIVEGEVWLDGQDLMSCSETEMQTIRGRKISMIFQEPRAALNPLFTVGDQISRVIQLREGCSRSVAETHAVEMMRAVEIADPDRRANAYPHEMSGGMCQRVMVAMALSANPLLLIADEPTTGLDVTVQAQVLDLIRLRVKSAGSACLFITHDLGVVAELCERVIVMYAGRVVEQGPVAEIFSNPRHPYTQGLIASTLRVDIDKPISTIPGTVPDAVHLPSGCTFHPRCPFAEELCQLEEPQMVEAGHGHLTRCHIVSGRIEREMLEEAWTMETA